MKNDTHATTLLGQPTIYPTQYSARHLCPIARLEGRLALGVEATLPFHGVDIWNHYEVSWLDGQGKPQVAWAEIHFPANSPSLIESKSMKLYFNSLNFERFSHQGELIRRVEEDLSRVVEAPVLVLLHFPDNKAQAVLGDLPGESLDGLTLACDSFELNSSVLNADPSHIVSEALHTHLLRSLCPVTGQPDWGSILLRYRGPAISHLGLLAYIVSYRAHPDFHEHCVERIYMDILRYCQPHELTVYARYTRRGGLDINPFRSNFEAAPQNLRLLRQ